MHSLEERLWNSAITLFYNQIFRQYPMDACEKNHSPSKESYHSKFFIGNQIHKLHRV